MKFPKRVNVSVGINEPLADPENVRVISFVEWPWPDEVADRDFTIFRESKVLLERYGENTEAAVMREISRQFELFARYLEKRAAP